MNFLDIFFEIVESEVFSYCWGVTLLIAFNSKCACCWLKIKKTRFFTRRFFMENPRTQLQCNLAKPDAQSTRKWRWKALIIAKFRSVNQTRLTSVRVSQILRCPKNLKLFSIKKNVFWWFFCKFSKDFHVSLFIL